MQELVHRLEAENEEHGLAINRSTTKLMVVDHAGLLSDTQTIHGISTADKCIHLGSKICEDGMKDGLEGALGWVNFP